MDDQFKKLGPDLDELEERMYPARKTHKPMDTGQAIIIAAIIMVAGLWGGKIYYDHLQEQRAIQAVSYLAKGFEQSTKQSRAQSAASERHMQQTMQQRRQEVEIERQKYEQQEQIKQANAAQAKKRESDKCRFWWDQDRTNPTEKTATNKAFYCEG